MCFPKQDVLLRPDSLFTELLLQPRARVRACGKLKLLRKPAVVPCFWYFKMRAGKSLLLHQMGGRGPKRDMHAACVL